MTGVEVATLPPAEPKLSSVHRPSRFVPSVVCGIPVGRIDQTLRNAVAATCDSAERRLAARPVTPRGVPAIVQIAARMRLDR